MKTMSKLMVAMMVATVSTFAYASEEGGHSGGNDGGNGQRNIGIGSGNGGGDRAISAQQQAADAQSASVNAGNAQSITFQSPAEQTVNYNYSGTQTVKNVPALGGPQLTSSNDTCMGSTSLGIAVAGFGGQFGTTWTDTNCVLLKNSRELWNMGMKAAALARMCMDGPNREALEITGFKCPVKPADAPAKTSAVEVTPVAPQAGVDMTDPYIAARAQ